MGLEARRKQRRQIHGTAVERVTVHFDPVLSVACHAGGMGYAPAISCKNRQDAESVRGLVAMAPFDAEAVRVLSERVRWEPTLTGQTMKT